MIDSDATRLSVAMLDVNEGRELEFLELSRQFESLLVQRGFGHAEIVRDARVVRRFYSVRYWTDAAAFEQCDADADVREIASRILQVARVSQVVNGARGLRDRLTKSDLVAAARLARRYADAAFSRFRVGAALQTAEGVVITGCNIENATYGLTICAERVAMFKALSEGHRAFTRLAIVADTEAPTPPCGACRQILWEFGGDLEIVLASLTEEKGIHSLKELLPLPFDVRLLKNRHSVNPMLPTIAREADAVVMIDQRKLPAEEVYVRCRTASEVARAIRTMVIRGAPAIGVAAAMGIALGLRKSRATGTQKCAAEFYEICELMAATRPTAVNLFWAIERMKRSFAAAAEAGESVDQIRDRLDREAQAIHDEDVASCRAMGAFGAEVVPADAHILTHCNAGALATAGYGTALGVVRGAVEAGKRVDVFADETRPFLQGARLTAWELVRDGIPTTVITDSMAGALMHQGRVNFVVVGADRIAANGDTANKIGTYGVAILAREHDIPFYVAAPLSTIDLDTPDGSRILIEERNAKEVTHLQGVRLAPEGASVWNPAFDVTPHHFIAGIITERGIFRAPYIESLKRACEVPQ